MARGGGEAAAEGELVRSGQRGGESSLGTGLLVGPRQSTEPSESSGR